MSERTERTERVRAQTRRVLAAFRDVMSGAVQNFLRHRTRRLGAGLAYYSIFALVPTLFLALSIVAAFFGREATEGRLVDALDGVVGEDVAVQIENAVASLWENTNTSGLAIVTAAVVIYSASTLFVAWRDALDTIWDVPYKVGVSSSLRRRAFGALVPLAVGVLLASIVLIEILTALAGDFITSPLLDAILRAVGSVSPVAVSFLALALLYRWSTRRRPDWRDIFVGTLVAAIALAVLSWGYGLYVRFFGSSSAAGAAGTVILGLAFVYYSAQALLFGGEMIRASAERRDSSPPT